MPETTLSTVKHLVEASIDETEKPAVRYKLRTASQLIDVIQYYNKDQLETLENADTDDELENKLRDMGFIE